MKHEELCGLPGDLDKDFHFCTCEVIRGERERLIAMLQRQIDNEKCDCGLLCEGWENGMNYAADSIRLENEDE